MIAGVKVGLTPSTRTSTPKPVSSALDGRNDWRIDCEAVPWIHQSSEPRLAVRVAPCGTVTTNGVSDPLHVDPPDQGRGDRLEGVLDRVLGRGGVAQPEAAEGGAGAVAVEGQGVGAVVRRDQGVPVPPVVGRSTGASRSIRA
jgi:hypothetical protein